MAEFAEKAEAFAETLLAKVGFGESFKATLMGHAAIATAIRELAEAIRPNETGDLEAALVSKLREDTRKLQSLLTAARQENETLKRENDALRREKENGI